MALIFTFTNKRNIMRILILSLLIFNFFIASFCFGQNDPLLGVQKDSTLVIDSVMVVDTVMVGDSMTFDTSFMQANYYAYQYTLIDTIGDVEAGNYYVRVEVPVSYTHLTLPTKRIV